MSLITVNTATDTFNDCSADADQIIEAVLIRMERFVPRPADSSRLNYTIGQILKFLACEAVAGEYNTDIRDFDMADEITSLVYVHAID